MERSGDVTVLCERIRQGDEKARGQLFSVVYGELHSIAAALRHKWRPNHTLQSCEIVNEAFLKLITGNATSMKTTRAFFFAAAARAMRQVLIDYQRKWRFPRNNGITTAGLPEANQSEETYLLALDDALDRLRDFSPEMAELIELKYYASLKIREIADLKELSTATVERRLRVARAFLQDRIEKWESDE